jgi:hypothetical protein
MLVVEGVQENRTANKTEKREKQEKGPRITQITRKEEKITISN